MKYIKRGRTALEVEGEFLKVNSVCAGFANEDIKNVSVKIESVRVGYNSYVKVVSYKIEFESKEDSDELTLTLQYFNKDLWKVDTKSKIKLNISKGILTARIPIIDKTPKVQDGFEIG